MNFEKHPLHIKNPDLQTSEEVEDAVEKHERLTGEDLPNEPGARIEAYMDRLENIFLNPDERVRERNLEMLREKIYDALIIKRENFPESYFELQKRVARERGQAIEEIPSDVREQMKDTAIEDQKASLDAWISYLTSDDAVYPAWFKYFVWRNITKLSQFDKERGEFKKRADTTVAPYPDIYREPLAQIADIYEKVKEDNKNLNEPEIREAFSRKFPALYAELIQKSLASQIENREEVSGQWVKYEQGNDENAEKLFESLEGKGTGWCTAGRSTAQTQIESGDFYVYYTNDTQGEPTQPRLAIRMEGDNRIGEVRGILPHQGVEPMMQEVLDGKLNEFGGEADAYRKKSRDMKKLTIIENAISSGVFSDDNKTVKEEFGSMSKALAFLYELDAPIEGFGYEEDPRIDEIRSPRNKEQDMLIIFECVKEQIAHNAEEINENTRAYVGEWNPTTHQTIKQFPNIKHRYESFPEKKIFMYNLETDPNINSPEKAEEAIKSKEIYLSDYSKDILYKTKFSHEGKTYELARFTVGQLGFPDEATTKEIYKRATKELGLELCPAEVGPHLRLKYPGKEFMLIAMKQITDRDGVLNVFTLGSSGGSELELDGHYAKLSCGWRSDCKFVFLSRPPSPKATDGQSK